ncbi:hypothetical protein H0H93_007642 [Arthromyces matolae]|nr:hypothetical protein H0H93_007642 [Arthromyces matolae]
MAAIDATPPKPIDSTPNSYRLLYRGALSLPDSHLLLDGLTFLARLDSPSKNNHLLENPLALALESMRGRPSLRFIGVVKLHDDPNLWMDESGGIEMDIHPRATLTRIYFENVFCLTPFASTSTSVPPNTSDVAIKVALGDTDGPDTTQALIYARCSQEDNSLSLIVARLTTKPPPTQPQIRLPRPDDPTPRKPPLAYIANAGVVNGGRQGFNRVPSLAPGRELKRAASVTSISGPKQKKVAGIDGAVVADLGSGVRLGLGDGKVDGKSDGLFKIPEVPHKLSAKARGKRVEVEQDVFGSIGTGSSSKPISKGKRKQAGDQDVATPDEEAVKLERANKDVIKRCTLDHLYKRKDPTTACRIDKTHPEFKDLFSWISRGVGFALRADLKARPVDTVLVENLVRLHADMYVGGNGNNSDLAPEGR